MKINFLQKVLKKWSSFRKKFLVFFHNRGGGGYGMFHNLKKKKILNPSLRTFLTSFPPLNMTLKIIMHIDVYNPALSKTF